ncbi:MAG TPA: hypothetical protein VM577_00995 [Anaerovoracaceae bacterium]|nr:hypothetical protein [Anaerovoracaceae bacterium]
MNNKKPTDTLKAVIGHPLFVYPLTALASICAFAYIVILIIFRTAISLIRFAPLIIIGYILWSIFGSHSASAAEVSTNMHVGAQILPYDHITISPSAQVSQQANDKVEPVIKKETVIKDGEPVTLITIYS